MVYIFCYFLIEIEKKLPQPATRPTTKSKWSFDKELAGGCLPGGCPQRGGQGSFLIDLVRIRISL